MSSRAIAISIGILAAALGIAALVVDTSVLGLLAGLFGVAAGGVVLAPQTARGPKPDDATPAPDEAGGSTVEDDAFDSSELVAELEATQSRLRVADGRIRTLEADLADARDSLTSAGDEASSLTDADSQLFSEAYFRVALDARIAAARRHLRPVAIALLEIHEGQADSISPVPPSRAAESIRQTIRDADTACRLGDGTFAVILEDTPENGAVWTVERIRRNIVSRFGSHTMWAGIACYPAHAFSTDELLTQAREALESAREWNQDRIEVAISE